MAYHFHDVSSGWYRWHFSFVFVFGLLPFEVVNYGEVVVGFNHGGLVAVSNLKLCDIGLYFFGLVEVCVLADACQYV